MTNNKEYYLSLPYREKLKALRNAIRIDFQYYLVVASYYLDASIEQGGLPANIVNQEFKKGLKRNHYFKNNINE